MYSDAGGYRIVDQYGTHFLTFTIVGWVDLFTRKACKNIIIDAFKYCIDHKGLILNAYVIMDSHVHLIASADESSTGLSNIIRDFKRATAKEILKWIMNNKKESRRDWLEIVFRYHGSFNNKTKDFQIWHHNNHPEHCFYPAFTLQKLNYIHRNPVVAGIVDDPCAYIYSSAKNYAGCSDVVLEVSVLEFGSPVGYIRT